MREPSVFVSVAARKRLLLSETRFFYWGGTQSSGFDGIELFE